MRIKINEENSDKVIKEPSPFSSHEHERGQVTSVSGVADHENVK